ncbi:DUF5719 family protein [Agrococcus sp. TF02-05]|uniref:DUF5719 family protein n=1 Tax=Agrococcus sp. TF02-05 TaxID=2815211 RepID=UPI001AA19288|nr:DUF5719 family protein [Agrococcus sp. TF02-05]MBO1770715.1 hypothetical protein [Agrococcus sp. TF02-05]
MTDRDGLGAIDDSQEFDDDSPIRDDEGPRQRTPSAEELAVEAEAPVADGDIATDVALTDREAAANDAADGARRVERRDMLRWGGRAGAGLGAVLLMTGAVLGAGALPVEPLERVEAPTTQVLPSSPLQSRVCAGPALRVGTSDGSDALALSTVAEPQVAIGSLGGEIAEQRLPVPMRDDISGGAAIAQRGEATTLSAAQSLPVDVDDARGLAVSECGETRLDQWLVGGSTRTGRQSTLTIANASQVSASVDVTVHGPEGPVETVGSTGISVPPASQAVLDLAAIAPGVDDVVVRVVSTGAPVSAHLQQSTTRGLERGGFEVVDAVSALTTAVLPGVVVTEPTGIETQEGFDDAAPALRLLSLEGGPVRVVFEAEDGSVIESEGDLEAGRVTDFELEEIPVGVTTIRISADSPIVAGARQVAIAADGNDFDWVAGGQPRSGRSAIAVPPGPGATLHVVSASEEPQEITVDGRAVELGALGVHRQPVEAGSVVVAGESLVVGVGYRDASRVAGFTASPQGPTAGGVTVVH